MLVGKNGRKSRVSAEFVMRCPFGSEVCHMWGGACDWEVPAFMRRSSVRWAPTFGLLISGLSFAQGTVVHLAKEFHLLLRFVSVTFGYSRFDPVMALRRPQNRSKESS